MESEQEPEQEPKQQSSIVVKKNHLWIFAGAVFMISIFALGAYAMVANGAANNGFAPTANAVKNYAPVAPVQGGKQIIKLTIQGGTYYPNPVRLKKNVPVVLDVDMASVRGCYRGIQIPAFNVKKIVSENDNKIEFTPDKAGTFGFSCLMGMGKGQIVVEDEAGNVPVLNTVAQDIPKGGSCGAGGGGCGCGG